MIDVRRLHLRSHTGWDDVEDFSSLAELLPAEANQPRILGDPGLGASASIDLSPRCLRTGQSLRSWSREVLSYLGPGSGSLVACLGVDDLVIVDMPDTLLVTTRARSQEVKRLVKKAEDAGWRSLLYRVQLTSLSVSIIPPQNVFGCLGVGLVFDSLVSRTNMQLFVELEQNRTEQLLLFFRFATGY